MILDTSAVIAVLRREEGHERLVEAMDGAETLAIGTPTLVETGIVTVRAYDVRGRSLIARFLEEKEVVVIPFSDQHWSVAADAFIRYGKGRHRACLNFGDCMTYATAKVADLPLLFIGDDFGRTDVVPA